jgi:signal transduction histidine kinase
VNSLLVRFSVLIFFLLLVLGGVLLFVLREQLLGAGVGEVEILWLLLRIGVFVILLVLVLTAVGVLAVLLLLYPISRRIREFAGSVAGLRGANFGSRVGLGAMDEVGDAAVAVNQLVEQFENQIVSAWAQTEGEHKHLIEEQGLLSLEQKKIYEEKEKLNYVLSRVRDGVIFVNKDRNVVVMNRAAEEIIGVKQNEAFGQGIGGIFKIYEESRLSSDLGESSEIVVDKYAPLKPGSDEAYIKKGVRLESGHATAKLVDFVVVPLKLIHVQDLGFMIVIVDQSASQEVEKKQLGLVSAFASELRLPLSMLSKYLSGDSGAQGSNAGSVYAGIASLSLLMDNLLTTSELENGTAAINSGEVDLARSIGHVVSVVNVVSVERQVSLQHETPKDFAAIVSGDERRVEQVVMNLALNAVHFTQAGGSVNITLSKTERDIILQIQDTGIGIASEGLPDLFRKFFVVDNDKGIDNGVGLGLYVSKKLVKLMNGKIWIDSVEGRGTVVSMSLPAWG